ncbi:Isochorismatase domain-containing protein 2A [Chlamydiales bacterium SCGC AG-110-M15]|nr:Isochorismatase domain-containing protein 2A [Chlamydiales bacterium SCGC AG-110-M15]
MSKHSLETIKPEDSALLLVDVQEKLLPRIDRGSDVTRQMQKVIKGAQALQIPIIVTEQYPQGLGSTVPPLKASLSPNQVYLPKTTFSCMQDTKIAETILSLPVKNWILIGIEAHICILQTARDLLREGKQVIAVNDAMSSRSIFDFSTAVAEMRDCGARITSTETILFELLKDAKHPQFKEVSKLFKEQQACCSAG